MDTVVDVEVQELWRKVHSLEGGREGVATREGYSGWVDILWSACSPPPLSGGTCPCLAELQNTWGWQQVSCACVCVRQAHTLLSVLS